MIDFSSKGIPRPRFLGICTSRECFSDMETNIPTEAYKPEDEDLKIGKADDRSFASFTAKMDAAFQATKNKSKGSKEKKKIQRVHVKSSRSAPKYPSLSVPECTCILRGASLQIRFSVGRD